MFGSIAEGGSWGMPTTWLLYYNSPCPVVLVSSFDGFPILPISLPLSWGCCSSVLLLLVVPAVLLLCLVSPSKAGRSAAVQAAGERIFTQYSQTLDSLIDSTSIVAPQPTLPSSKPASSSSKQVHRVANEFSVLNYMLERKVNSAE